MKERKKSCDNLYYKMEVPKKILLAVVGGRKKSKSLNINQCPLQNYSKQRRISKQHWQDSSGEWSIESWREESMEKSLLCVSQLEIRSVLLVNFVFEGNWNQWLCSVLTSSNMTPCCVVQVNNKYALSTIVHLESFAAVFNTVPQKRTLHYHPKTKIIFKTKTR